MESMITLSLQLHLVFIGMLVFVIGINIYWLRSDRGFYALSKRLELLAPQYYIVLSAILFTGILVMAVRHFAISHSVIVMIIAWCLLIGLGIKMRKLYKNLTPDEPSQEAYKAVALKKYLFDLLVVFCVVALHYGA